MTKKQSLRTKLKRVYHPIWLWEEIPANMWGDSAPGDYEKAIAFTGNHNLYGSYMHKVAKEWTYSCENALTDYSINRKAWIGHAAVAYALNIPEDITRKAWKVLTYEQQLLANNQARRAIALWEEDYRKHKQLHSDMGEQMLFRWNP